MKMAEVAPMPGAGVAMAVAAKVGLRRSDRIACWRSAIYNESKIKIRNH
jgi:hypothetical protein